MSSGAASHRADRVVQSEQQGPSRRRCQHWDSLDRQPAHVDDEQHPGPVQPVQGAVQDLHQQVNIFRITSFVGRKLYRPDAGKESGSQFTEVGLMRLQVQPGALGAEAESQAPYKCHPFEPLSETGQVVIQISPVTEIFPDSSQCKWHETYGGISAGEEAGPDLLQQEDGRPSGQVRGQYPEDPRGMR